MMVAIGFSAWDKDYCFRVIRDGVKDQTIRRPRKRPIKVGDKLQLYWKMRTKECEKIADAECIDTMKVRISPESKMVELCVLDEPRANMWTNILQYPRIFCDFWIRDGFECEADFWDYFKEGGIYQVIRWSLTSTVAY